MSSRLRVEDRRMGADTHLAWLGVKIAGNGILGHTEDINIKYKSFYIYK